MGPQRNVSSTDETRLVGKYPRRTRVHVPGPGDTPDPYDVAPPVVGPAPKGRPRREHVSPLFVPGRLGQVCPSLVVPVSPTPVE